MPFGSFKVALLGSGGGGSVDPFVAWYAYDDAASVDTRAGGFRRFDDDDNFILSGKTEKTDNSQYWMFFVKIDKEGEVVSSSTSNIGNTSTGGQQQHIVYSDSTYGWWAGGNYTNSSGYDTMELTRWDDQLAVSGGDATSATYYQRGGYPFTSFNHHDYATSSRGGLVVNMGTSNSPPRLLQQSYVYDSYANYRWEVSNQSFERTNSLNTLVRAANSYNQQTYGGGNTVYDTSDFLMSVYGQGGSGYQPYVTRCTDTMSIYGNGYRMTSSNGGYNCVGVTILGHQDSTDWYMQILDAGSNGYDTSILKMTNFPTSYGSNFTYAWKKAFRPASTRTHYYPVWSADPITDSSGNVYQMNAFYNATDNNKREMFVIKRNSSGTIQWVNQIKWNSTAGNNTNAFGYPMLELNKAEDMVYLNCDTQTLYPQPGYRYRNLVFCLNADGSTSGNARFDDNWNFDIANFTSYVDETSTWSDEGAGINLSVGFSSNSYANNGTASPAAVGQSGNTYDEAKLAIS